MQFFLSNYTIRLTEKGKRKKNSSPEYLKLDNLPNQKDFFDVLKDCLKGLSTNNYVDENNKKVIRIIRYEANEEERKIYGILKTGTYGMNTDIVSVKTGNVTYQKNTEDAEIIPYFFMVLIPKERDEAIMLLERIGNSGIKQVFENVIKNYINDNYIGVNLATNQIVSDQILNQILQRGIVKKMRFIKYHIPSDRFNVLDNGHEEMELDREIIISSKGLKDGLPIVNKLTSLINQNITVKELFEVGDNDYDTLKIEVDIAGRQKTIDLNELLKINHFIDITDELDIGRDNYPSFESLTAIFSGYCEEICRLIYKD